MGWRIGIKENTLRMDQEVAYKLIATSEASRPYLSYSDTNGIEFCLDAMQHIDFPDCLEHIDFLWEDWALDILNHPSVNGDVVFMSAEGNNDGKIWGYRFMNGVPLFLDPVISYKAKQIERN